MTPDEEKRCEAVLVAAFQGLHHIPGQLKKHPLYWSCNTYGGMATHDFDMLTVLVLAAHDQGVRVELSQGGPRMLKIMLHPRRCRSGGISTRHPTIETKLAEWRKFGHTAVELPENELREEELMEHEKEERKRTAASQPDGSGVGLQSNQAK